MKQNHKIDREGSKNKSDDEGEIQKHSEASTDLTDCFVDLSCKNNKTSVKSVKLGKTSDLSKSLSRKFSTPCQKGLRWIIHFMNPLIFVRKA